MYFCKMDSATTSEFFTKLNFFLLNYILKLGTTSDHENVLINYYQRNALEFGVHYGQIVYTDSTLHMLLTKLFFIMIFVIVRY